jgi:hypothetical protein
MKASWIVVLLATMVALLGGIAAGIGFFRNKAAVPRSFQTIRGDKVSLYGAGLYRFDSLFFGAGYKGQDAVVLFLGVPLLIITILLYQRGSLVGHLLLIGLLGYFIYVYASMAFGAAYNPLFLLYTAVFGFSLFGFIIVFNSAVLKLAAFDDLSSLPGSGLIIFMFVSGAITLFVWGAPLIEAFVSGSAPARMDSYTTMVTYAFDLAIITPATIICGFMILRGNALGYILAMPLLTLIVLLAPQIILSTIFQYRAGVPFSAGEMIGPMAGFVVLGAVGLWFLIRLLRSIPNLT